MNDRNLPLADARARIVAACRAVTDTERVTLREASGRVLASDLISPVNVPPHDNSAMDGYALRHGDLAAGAATRLTVVGQAYAGHPWHGRLAAGQAVRIMTGAMVPDGADTVVMQEVVTVEDDTVLIPAGQIAGQNRRCCGEDLLAGEPALPAGRLLRPSDVGLAASLGIGELEVFRRLRVAVLSTGDELMAIGETSREGGIYDSNRHTLVALLSRLGCEVLDLGVARDTKASLDAALDRAVGRVDAIVTSGGVSDGEADFVREVLAGLGEVAFWKIAMKPGRPMAFGRLSSNGRDTLLFGLPGNPVATMVAFYFIARDGLLAAMGVHPLPTVPLFEAISDSAIRKLPGRTEFQRGRLVQRDGRWHVAVSGAQGSGMLRSMCDADCMVVLDHDCGAVAAGDTVRVAAFQGLL